MTAAIPNTAVPTWAAIRTGKGAGRPRLGALVGPPSACSPNTDGSEPKSGPCRPDTKRVARKWRAASGETSARLRGRFSRRAASASISGVEAASRRPSATLPINGRDARSRIMHSRSRPTRGADRCQSAQDLKRSGLPMSSLIEHLAGTFRFRPSPVTCSFRAGLITLGIRIVGRSVRVMLTRRMGMHAGGGLHGTRQRQRLFAQRAERSPPNDDRGISRGSYPVADLRRRGISDRCRGSSRPGSNTGSSSPLMESEGRASPTSTDAGHEHRPPRPVAHRTAGRTTASSDILNEIRRGWVISGQYPVRGAQVVIAPDGTSTQLRSRLAGQAHHATTRRK